jgi:hypothetical protein
VSPGLRRALVVAAGLLAALATYAAAWRLLALAVDDARAGRGDPAADAGAALLALALAPGPDVAATLADLAATAAAEGWLRVVAVRVARARQRVTRGLLLSVAAGR